MWPAAGGGGGYYWPQAQANNPTPQQSEPSDWAAKAAQWAQQKSIQEQQAYQQQLAQYQQQQQQMLAMQQQQQQYQQQQAYQAPAPQQPPPTQATPPQPKPLFNSGGSHSNSGELGPGNIEQPPRSGPPPSHYGPPEGGYRGRGGRPPQFQRGGYRGGPRGGMRPRVPRPQGPRGHPPRQWEQQNRQSPGDYEHTRQESFGNEAPTEEYYQGREHDIPTHHGGDIPDRAHWSEEQDKSESVHRQDEVKPFNDEDLYSKLPEPDKPLLTEVPPSKPPEPKPVKSQVERDEDSLYANSAKRSKPTIASLQKNNDGAIPGLGEISAQPPPPTAVEPPSTTERERPKSEQDKMLASLGKLVTELQGLKGLTSSLQLLQSLPRPGDEELAKKKAAALLANESDSEGESQPHPKRESAPEPQTSYADNKPIRSQDAREFEDYSVKPQVYGTYSQEDYPEAGRGPDYRGREEYPHKYQDRGYEYSEGRRPPPERFYPPDRDRYEDQPSRSETYQEREWMESHEYGRGGYRDEKYPPGERLPPEERYPPREQFPQGERFTASERYPPEDQYPPDAPSRERFPPGEERFMRERFPPPEMPPAREGRFADGPPPRRFQGEEFRRPPPAREGYGYGGHVSAASRDERGSRAPERPSFSASQIESFDYGHGDRAPAIVDYNHGKGGVVTEQTSDRPVESAYRGQGSSGGFPPGPAESSYGFPGVGGFPSGMPYFPAGVDPAHAALIAAAFTAQQAAGESKRKALPAWLRDELEKMEAKRQKELDKETKKKEGAVQEGRGTWRDEIESDEEEADKKEEKKGRSKRTYRQKSLSPKSSKSGDAGPSVKRKKYEPAAMDDEEEKEITKILKIRRMLTEILLEVTDQEIDVVAKEVIEEEKKPKLSFPFKKPGSSQSMSEGVLAELRKYDTDSDSDEEDSNKGRKSDKHKSQVDPLAIAKAFADTVAGAKLGPVPPPSKEHQEWADKLLSNLTPRSRKDSSRNKLSKSEEKRSDSRSSGDEYSKRSSHKKRDKDKESRSKSSSHSRKSSDSPISSKRSARKSHSPPPPSGMSLITGFPPPKALTVRGGASSPTRRRGHRSRSRSHSPKRKVSYGKDRSRSRSPSSRGSHRYDKTGPGKQRKQASRWSEERPGSSGSQGKSPTAWSGGRPIGSADGQGKSADWVGGRPPGKGGSRSQRKSPTWSGGRPGGGANYRIVTRK